MDSTCRIYGLLTIYQTDDEYPIGYFKGNTPLNFWLFLLIGPLFLLSRIRYDVYITNKGLHFFRYDMYKRVIQHDFFAYFELRNYLRQDKWCGTLLLFYFPHARRLRLYVERQPENKPFVFRRSYGEFISGQMQAVV